MKRRPIDRRRLLLDANRDPRPRCGQDNPTELEQVNQSPEKTSFSHSYHPPIDFPNPMIMGQEIEKEMVHCFEDAIGRFHREGRTGSAYVGFSMIGIEGKRMFATFRTWFDRDSFIRQNTFTSPEIYVDLNEQEDSPYERLLRPLVDTLWQLDGRVGTPFTPGGVWNPFFVERI
jgi:hypothetical protein